jgi:hypothetical protein
MRERTVVQMGSYGQLKTLTSQLVISMQLNCDAVGNNLAGVEGDLDIPGLDVKNRLQVKISDDLLEQFFLSHEESFTLFFLSVKPDVKPALIFQSQDPKVGIKGESPLFPYFVLYFLDKGSFSIA